MRWLLAFVVAFLSFTIPARAGTVSGYYIAEDGARVELAHVTAVRLDGAEGVEPATVRVLLSDRPVPVGMLDRVLIPEIFYMGMAGEVRGLLLELDPGDPNHLSLTRLDPSSETGRLTAGTYADVESLWKRLEGDGNRVAGEFEPRSGIDAAFRFETDVDHDPVIRRIEGAEAQQTEWMRIFLERIAAAGRGDGATVRRLSTRRAAARDVDHPAEIMPEIRRMAEAVAQAARTRGFILVRRRTVTLVLGPDSAATFEQEDGQWKVAD